MSVTASAAGYLNAWIDFNGDGDWNDAWVDGDEHVFDSVALVAGENVISFTMPSLAAEGTLEGSVIGKTFARFRLSSDPSLEPTGVAPDGEVEDYQVLITDDPRDYGDAPRSFSTMKDSEPATAHLILSGENNDILLTAVEPGTVMNDIEIIIINDHAYGDLAFVEYDSIAGNFIIDVDPQRTTANAVVTAINDYVIEVNNELVGVFTAELSDSADPDNDGTGLLPMQGTVAVTANGQDGFGEDAACHLLTSDLYLGTRVDAELDGQPDDGALGDDDTDFDDEDGVSLPPRFVVGTTSVFDVEVHLGSATKAYLYAWMDLNLDGAFSDDEQILYGDPIQQTDPPTDDPLTIPVTVTIPVTAMAGDTYARFRLSTDTDLSYDGDAGDGEIEDYQVEIVRGTGVITGWMFEDRDRDGVFDRNEDGIAGVIVYVDADNNKELTCDDHDNPVEPFIVTMEDDLSTVDVDETGYYEFDGLAGRPNPYTIRFDETDLKVWASTYPDHTVVFPDGSHGNDDRSYTIYLEEDETLDDVNFGNYHRPSVCVDDVTVIEGNEGYTEVEVTLRLTDSFGAPVEIHYETTDHYVKEVDGQPKTITGTATPNADFVQKTGSLTFDPQATPAPTWDINVLTANASNDYDYGVSGKYVVWEGFDGNDWEIYLFSGDYYDEEEELPIILQLTDNSTDDHFASLWSTGPGVNVVWTGYEEDGSDLEIFLYESAFPGATSQAKTVRLTDNLYNDRDPRVSESLVTWWANDAGDAEIFVVDLENFDTPGEYSAADEVVNLTDNELDDRDPEVSGRNVAWTGTRGSNLEVFVFNGEDEEADLSDPSIIQVTSNSRADQAIQIDGDKVVWEGKVGTTHEIFLYEIDTQTTTQVTSNSQEDRYPQISGNNVVWQSYSSYNWEIFHYNTVAQTAPENISNNPAYEEMPQIAGSNIVWRAFTNNNWEVFYYDLDGAGIVSNVSNSVAYDFNPQVSSVMVIWRASEGGDDFEILVATQNQSEVVESVTLRIIGDKVYEPDEHFFLKISAADPGMVYVEDEPAKIHILNDDGSLDYGDAPDPTYPTLLANNGARHQFVEDIYLGQNIDVESDGRPTANADGDDTWETDDENGIHFDTVLAQDSPGRITATVSLDSNHPYAYLDGWIDFNGDGKWDDKNEEHIFDAVEVQAGQNQLMIQVPAWAVIGDTYARFRLTTDGQLGNDDPDSGPTFAGYMGQAADGEVEDYLVEIVPRPLLVNGVLSLSGTDGNDVFEFFSGETLRVKLNGAEFVYDLRDPLGKTLISQILFDGGSGDDTVLFHGSALDESVDLRPDRGVFNILRVDKSAECTVDTTNVEYIEADAWLGQDVPDDVAVLHDSIDDDLFEGRPGLATMTRSGSVILRAEGFVNAQALSSAGGSDTAQLHGSTDNDLFTGDSDSSQMETGNGYSIGANGFQVVSAYSEGYEDGNPDEADRADLSDSAGDDTFTSYPTRAIMSGPGYEIEVHSFRYVDATSEDGTDRANMFDSPGDEIYTANPDWARLKTDENSSPAPDNPFQVTVYSFRYVAASASSGGDDAATLEDSPGEDTLKAGPTYAKLYGANFHNRADYFPIVYAEGKNGGEDVVELHDSPGDDEVIAGVNTMSLTGPGFKVSVSNFQHMVAFAGEGYDEAHLQGTNGDDVFQGTPIYGKLISADRSFRAYGFDVVKAWGGGGNDDAYLHDSDLADLLEAGVSTTPGSEAWAQLSNQELDFLLWVADFEYVLASSTSSGDRKDVDDAVDFLFTEGLWEDI